MPSEMGTNETKAASSQMAAIVMTATRRVTQRPYLQWNRKSERERDRV